MLRLHLQQLLWLLVAGFFYLSKIPERLWPNRFDIWASSHQLFHVAIYLNMYYGALAAFGHLQGVAEEERSLRSPSSFASILLYPLAVVVVEAGIIATCVLRGPLYNHPGSSLKPFKGHRRR